MLVAIAKLHETLLSLPKAVARESKGEVSAFEVAVNSSATYKNRHSQYFPADQLRYIPQAESDVIIRILDEICASHAERPGIERYRKEVVAALKNVTKAKSKARYNGITKSTPEASLKVIDKILGTTDGKILSDVSFLGQQLTACLYDDGIFSNEPHAAFEFALALNDVFSTYEGNGRKRKAVLSLTADKSIECKALVSNAAYYLAMVIGDKIEQSRWIVGLKASIEMMEKSAFFEMRLRNYRAHEGQPRLYFDVYQDRAKHAGYPSGGGSSQSNVVRGSRMLGYALGDMVREIPGRKTVEWYAKEAIRLDGESGGYFVVFSRRQYALSLAKEGRFEEAFGEADEIWKVARGSGCLVTRETAHLTEQKIYECLADFSGDQAHARTAGMHKALAVEISDQLSKS